MRRFLALILAASVVFGCAGCGLTERLRQRAEGAFEDAQEQLGGYIDDAKEQAGELVGEAQAKVTEFIEYMNTEHEYIDPEDVLIEEAYAALFDALDNRDAEAILALFAENVRKQDKNIEAEVRQMLDRWPGNTELWYYDGISSGSYSTNYGVKTAEVTAMIPVFAGDEVFWVLLDIMYRDDRDEKNEGVTRMLFYTAEDYCLLLESEDYKYPSEDGLHVAISEPDDPHVVCINQYPVRMADAEPLDPAEVEAFVQTNQTYSGFIECFGPPHGTGSMGLLSAYYWLPAENGEPRFLELGVTEWEDEIWGVYVQTALDTVDELWYCKDQQETTPTE